MGQTPLGYRVIPGLADSGLAKAHFWLHQLGALVLLIGLFLLMTGRVVEETIGPVFLVAEIAIFLAVLSWLVNLFQFAR